MPDETMFGYGQLRFSWGDHICAIFESHTQQSEVMVPFIANGLRAGQQCVWVGPRESAEWLRAGLAEAGGDLPTLEASGQLTLISEVDFYLRGGVFEPERTIDLMLSLLGEGRGRGYETTRAATDVSWLGTSSLSVDMWAEYEIRVSQEMLGRPAVWVCQYNARQVQGELVMAALQTHPVVILGDVVKENPFYEAPGADAAAPRTIH